jgi:molybdopterin converting factor small subunit
MPQGAEAVATVHFPTGMMRFTGGVDHVTVDAPRVRDLLTTLAELYPGLAELLEETAVAIDGEIYQDPGYQSLNANSEVHLVPRIAGG